MSSRDDARARMLVSTGLVGAVLAMGVAAPAGAQVVTEIAGDARVIASDNPFLLSGGDTEALAFEVAARPELRWQAGPATAVELSGEAAYRRYTRRYGDFVTGRADAVVTHRASDFLSADARLSYARELPIDALTESIDFSIDPRSVRQRMVGRGSATWTPNARDRVVLGAGWETLRYSRPGLLGDTRAIHADVEASRRISERTRLGVMATATRSRIDTIGDLSGLGVRGIVEQRFSSTLEGRGELGVEWTRYQIAGGNRRAQLSGSVNLCYRPDRIEACATASIQNETSGLGGLQRERFVGATLRYRLDEHSNLTALAEHRSARLTGPFLAADTSATRAGAGYERTLGRRLMLAGNVDYLRRSFLSGSRGDAVVFRIGITFGRDGR